MFAQDVHDEPTAPVGQAPNRLPFYARPMTATTRSQDLVSLDAVDQLALLRSGSVSAVELLDAHLDRIDAINPGLNAIVALDPDVARPRAEAVDATRAQGRDPGPLAGLVIAHKDLTDTADFPTTYGSATFADHRPSADSLLVERTKQAGAVAVGKTNVPEFGRGSHTFNSVYGTTRNPYDPSRTAGGSSGGAGVALRTGMVSIADGSDMGGSLRNPAGWNNVVGFRASPGVVPSLQPGPPWPRLGTEGAMGRSVDDLALLLSVISAPDSRDPLSRGLGWPDLLTPVEGPLRVAWSPTLGGLPVEDDVAAVLHHMPEACAGLGWEVVEAEPDFSGADETFATLRGWLMAHGQARALGDRLGELKQTIKTEAADGARVSAEQAYDALAHLGVLWRRAADFFAQFDLLMGPVSQVSPFPIEVEYPTEVAGQPMSSYIQWMMSCCRITVMGSPALSLPAGFTDAGLPCGVQLIGGPNADIAVLRAAKALEAATAHGRVLPPGS